MQYLYCGGTETLHIRNTEVMEVRGILTESAWTLLTLFLWCRLVLSGFPTAPVCSQILPARSPSETLWDHLLQEHHHRNLRGPLQARQSENQPARTKPTCGLMSETWCSLFIHSQFLGASELTAFIEGYFLKNMVLLIELDGFKQLLYELPPPESPASSPGICSDILLELEKTLATRIHSIHLSTSKGSVVWPANPASAAPPTPKTRKAEAEFSMPEVPFKSPAAWGWMSAFARRPFPCWTTVHITSHEFRERTFLFYFITTAWRTLYTFFH